ncbi:BTAD domain-containing putative transcriptional regulator [Corallococcus aberystwythensis]|uniref:BTAD domain-containing putative transcriptional regulator n=1 Tax=Corallococcus aberystwythensis TaxID=2316722 RepID=UPI0027BB0065|nr:BTAD domain-containing putative transcriptional regulator [Corallococcus aberystwythensis]
MRAHPTFPETPRKAGTDVVTVGFPFLQGPCRVMKQTACTGARRPALGSAGWRTGVPVRGRGGGAAVNASARHGSAARRLLAQGSDTDAETPMSERESMKLRELKEAAHALYQRGRYAQCVETYAQLAKRLPRDANVRVRLAEACRRAGQREQAIAAYREAAQVLLSLGCESRARGALKAALELDPRDPTLQMEVVRLGQGAVTPTELEDEQLYRFDRLPPPTPPPGRMRSVPPPPPPSFVLNAAQEPAAPAGLPVAPPIAPLNVRGTPNAMPGPGRQAVLPHPRPAAPLARDAAIEAMSRSMSKAAGTPEAAPLPKVIVSMAAFEDPPAASTPRAPGNNTPPGIAPVTVGRTVPQKALPGVPLGLPALPRNPLDAAGVKPAVPPERPTVKVIALLNHAPGALPTPPPSAPVPHATTNHPHASALTAPPMAVLPYKPEMRRLAPNVVALRVSPQARWVIIRSESELEVSRSEALPDEPAAVH